MKNFALTVLTMMGTLYASSTLAETPVQKKVFECLADEGKFENLEFEVTSKDLDDPTEPVRIVARMKSGRVILAGPATYVARNGSRGSWTISTVVESSLSYAAEPELVRLTLPDQYGISFVNFSRASHMSSILGRSNFYRCEPK